MLGVVLVLLTTAIPPAGGAGGLLAQTGPLGDGALVPRVRAPTGALTLVRGATVQVEVESRLKATPTGDLDGQVTPLSRGGGVSILGWTEEVEIRPGRNGSTVHTQVVVRADARAPLGQARASARIEVVDRGNGRTIAVLGLDVVVQVVEARGTADDVDRALAAYQQHQRRAEQGAPIVPPLGAPLRLDRVEMPPRGPSATGSDRLALRGFLASRLRADVARDHLRALAARTSTNTTVAAVSERAVRALGSLVDPPPRLGDRPAALADPGRGLEQAIALFDRLELEWAQRVLIRARFTPTLPLARLPDVLVRLGAVEAARGDDAAAQALIGQALCLRPDLAPPSPYPPMSTAFAEVRARGRCSEVLGVHSVSAEAITTDEGAGVRVRVLLGPDPYHVVDRGVLELLDETDAVRSTRELIAERGDLAGLVADFGEGEVGARSDDRIRIRARALDVAGLELIRQEAVSVALVQSSDPDDDGVAWWVWVVGGALVAAGATTAAVLATRSNTAEPTVGPVLVTF